MADQVMHVRYNTISHHTADQVMHVRYSTISHHTAGTVAKYSNDGYKTKDHTDINEWLCYLRFSDALRH